MLSVIVPTIGRPSLDAALRSIECQPGDEVLVVGDVSRIDQSAFRPHVRFIPCTRGEDWGRKERLLGMSLARGRYLVFLDDDDTYVPGHRAAMQRAIEETPGVPALFRMVYPNGSVLWREPVLREANVSTQMMLIPNDPTKLGQWSGRREGDFDFLASMAWSPETIVWREDVIAALGHNDA